MADAFVEVYEGLLGGGKTYSVVWRLFNMLCEGRTVITNIDIVWDKMKEEAEKRAGVILEDDQLLRLTPENVATFDQHVKRGTRECPVVMALDELHMFFNSRDWAQTNAKSRGIIELITQIRKINVHLIIITQDRNNLDKQFVRMVQYFWRCRDLSKWKIPVGPFKIGYPAKHILTVCRQKENEKVIHSKKYVPLHSWVYGMYRTEALAKSLHCGFEQVERRTLRKVEKKPLPKHALIPLGVGMLVGPLVFGFLRPPAPPEHAVRRVEPFAAYQDGVDSSGREVVKGEVSQALTEVREGPREILAKGVYTLGGVFRYLPASGGGWERLTYFFKVRTAEGWKLTGREGTVLVKLIQEGPYQPLPIQGLTDNSQNQAGNALDKWQPIRRVGEDENKENSKSAQVFPAATRDREP